MQEIEYEDGTKTKKFFDSFCSALDDSKVKALNKGINKVTITRVIPKKRK